MDGTNTDKYPYTCQSSTSEYSGIYINKSLSLIGYGSSLPEIRCSAGTSLAFIGSDNAEKMTVTLSKLFFNESFVRVQDFSVEINECTFEGSKQGIQFVITTETASNIEITNSTFSRNQECFSVVVTGTAKNPSQDTQVMFKLANSSFDGNIFSGEGTCISFTESPYSNHSASSNITLENVTFSSNKFSSNGLVFLKIDNGNQNIRIQNVTFIGNRPLSGADRDVLTSSGDCECIIQSSAVNIVINSSNFTSEVARSFNVSASNISLQIFNSSFAGYSVVGNGGVISLRGTNVCKLKIFYSSFVNTTAAQGGAINVECSYVYSVSFEDNVFTDNTAANGRGGAVYINSLGSVVNHAEYWANKTLKFHAQSPEKLTAEINITKCAFNIANSFFGGGAVYINAVNASVRLCYSTFSNSRTQSDGGAVYVSSISAVKVHQSRFFNNTAWEGGAISIRDLNSRNSCHVAIERSTFLNNNADGAGAIYIRNAILTFETVTMESNRAHSEGGAVALEGCSVVKARQSRFFNNTALEEGGAFYVINPDFNTLEFEVQECCFDNNYAASGGALAFALSPALAYPASVLITNTTFNNCWSDGPGGALILRILPHGNVSLEVKSSRFVDNYS